MSIVPPPFRTAQQAGRDAHALQFAPLDKSSFVPMYAQIQAQLQAMIGSGHLRPGDLLPSEEELSRVYLVSRMTARQALQALKAQGLADRLKGLGTFVAQPKVEKDITHLAGFTAEMQALGLQPSSRLLAAEVVAASEKIAASLKIPAAAPVFLLRRLRFADGLPMAFEESHVSIDRFPGIERLDFREASLYTTLRQRYGVLPSMSEEVLEAQPAERAEARMLELPPRACLLIIHRVLLNAEGEPVETARSCYRGDRYQATLRIPARTNI